MEAVLKDPNIDAVVPVLNATKDHGVPPFDFIIKLSKKFPDKPIMVTFSADKQKYMDESKISQNPSSSNLPEIEQPFEVLSILYRLPEGDEFDPVISGCSILGKPAQEHPCGISRKKTA